MIENKVYLNFILTTGYAKWAQGNIFYHGYMFSINQMPPSEVIFYGEKPDHNEWWVITVILCHEGLLFPGQFLW